MCSKGQGTEIKKVRRAARAGSLLSSISLGKRLELMDRLRYADWTWCCSIDLHQLRLAGLDLGWHDATGGIKMNETSDHACIAVG